MNIVFDIGGTNMRVAAADGDELGEIQKVPTPQDPQDGIARLLELAKAHGSTEAAAGCISADKISAEGVLSGARNLRAWEGTNLVGALSDALGAPVRIVNDAVLVGYGEKMRGAGKGFSTVAYMTVSTGVGGARISDDALERSPILGNLKLAVGDLEALVSGTAVRAKFGIHPKDLDSLEERNKLADILAQGLAEIAQIWKPDVFVLGGSMIVGKNPIPLERVRERFATIPVKMAELGDSGGLIGGAILAQQA